MKLYSEMVENDIILKKIYCIKKIPTSVCVLKPTIYIIRKIQIVIKKK